MEVLRIYPRLDRECPRAGATLASCVSSAPTQCLTQSFSAEDHADVVKCRTWLSMFLVGPAEARAGGPGTPLGASGASQVR